MNIEKREMKTVAGLIRGEKMQERFKEVLGKRAPQFCSSVIAISQQRHLQMCNPESVLASAMVAATLNLPVNPTLGLAYLVPYKGQAQFQIGYKGLVQLAIRSGQYKHLNAFSVFEGQIASINRRTGEIEFDDSVDETGDPIGFGAYLETVNGYQHTVYWSREQIEQHAERFSQAFRSKKYDSPWISDFESMAKKTVLKNLLTHWGPLSVELETAISRDMTTQHNLESSPTFDDNVEAIDVKEEEVPTKKKTRRTQIEILSDRLAEYEIDEKSVLIWVEESTDRVCQSLADIPKPMIKQIIKEPALLKTEIKQQIDGGSEPKADLNAATNADA